MLGRTKNWNSVYEAQLLCGDCRGIGLVKNLLDEDEQCNECHGTGKAH